MSKYRVGRKYHRLPKRVYIVCLVIILIFIAGSFIVRKIYDDRLKPVNNSSITKIVTINSGSSVKQIGDLLASDHLIRSSWAMQLWCR